MFVDGLECQLKREPMAWRCPACGLDIRGEEQRQLSDRPTRAKIYRCHVCRLELEWDEGAEKLTLAPWPPDREPPKAA